MIQRAQAPAPGRQDSVTISDEARRRSLSPAANKTADELPPVVLGQGVYLQAWPEPPPKDHDGSESMREAENEPVPGVPDVSGFEHRFRALRREYEQAREAEQRERAKLSLLETVLWLVVVAVLIALSIVFFGGNSGGHR